MKLKRVKIAGFKSFAKQTFLDFQEGITAIVGPNGCGKSNIVDAFRWVMGEQSARSIRGDKMLDVIFSGTTDVKALNLAEVTLTFSDVRGELPVEYDEVSICRRVHRSGESEFFINNQPVRLKDIDSLFWDSGLGKNAFCIFEQGKIDEIITHSPLERRGIFEDAAGISRFKQRKKETLRKLEQVDANLLRVKDICREVEKQRLSLEQQAEVATAYRKNQKALETLEKGLYVAKGNAVKRELKAIAEKKVKAEEERELGGTKMEQLQGALAAKRQALQGLEESLRLANETLHRCKSQLEIQKMERRSLEEHVESGKARIAKIGQEMQQLRQRRAEGKETLIHQTQHYTELEQAWKKSCSEVQAAQKEQARLQATVDELRVQWKGQQGVRLEAMQLEGKAQSVLQEKAYKKQRLEERAAQLMRDKERDLQRLQSVEEEIAEKRAGVKDLSALVSSQKQALQKIEETLSGLQLQESEARKACEAAIQEHAELAAKERVLTRLKEEMEGISSGTKRLIKESKDKKSPLFQLITPLYEILGEQEMAPHLVVALKPYHQTLVVDSKEKAAAVLQHAKKLGVADFSLVCIASAKKRGVWDRFAGRVDAVEDAPAAWLKGVASQQAVTVLADGNGGSVDLQWVLHKANPSDTSTFARESELKQVAIRRAQVELSLEKLKCQLEALRKQRDGLQGERLVCDKEVRKQEMRLVEVNFLLQQALQTKEKVEKELCRHDQEAKELLPAQKTLAAEMGHVQAQLADAQKHTQVVQAATEKLEKKLELSTRQFQEHESFLRDKEKEQNLKGQERLRLQNARLVFETKDKENAREEEHLLEALKREEAETKTLEKKGPGLHKALEAAEKEVAKAEKAFADMQGKAAKEKEAIATAETKAGEAHGKIRVLEESVHRLEVARAQALATLEALQAACKEQFQIDLEMAEAEVGVCDESPDKLEKRVRVVRKELDGAGNVNLASIDEFEQAKERQAFLNQQIEDLTASKEELLQIIAQLEGESRVLFAEVFEKIRANFQKNFQLLFQGGQADLTFTDAKDILEAGVEITAKPPGKQMRSITLLSGGEKCLTAMALLFAIFEVKPSAFCLLDEVDAPLDESNVDRLTHMLAQFTHKTQFIVITHNKRTMAVADRLYGISMQQKGVSTVLPLQLKRHEELAETIAGA